MERSHHANRSRQQGVGQYDGVLFGVPNPVVLLSPMTTQEAVISSKIEGTQATLGEVLKFEAGEEIDGESKRLRASKMIDIRHGLLIS